MSAAAETKQQECVASKMDYSQVVSQPDPLSEKEMALMDAYWRASNYLTVGQIYLKENPMLREPLKAEHIKPRLLGHWGTSPGLNILYVHMNRIIQRTGSDVVFMVGPGHGGPALVAQTYLEGTWLENYPKSGVTPDDAGMRKLFRQFSAPGGIPSHCSPDVPGSIHEGGELGYVLVHAFGAVMDSPDLVVLAVVGDGEAETGPLEGSWKSISFINPVHDGAVLPVMHLNEAKISGPTVLGRESNDNIRSLFHGHGYEVIFVEGDDPKLVHQLLAKALDYSMAKIRAIQKEARAAGKCEERPRWPLIIMRTPKGWTGPKVVDGKKVSGTFRSHQVPLATVRENDQHKEMLEEWMRSYNAQDLFDAQGKFIPELAALAPQGLKRMSATPYANGGIDPKPLVMPDIRSAKYALDIKGKPGVGARTSSVTQLGFLLRDLYKENPTNFRLFCPDETNSNRCGAVFETQKRSWMLPLRDFDEALGHDGRVMEVLSEHCCNGWMEGYGLTGRHGIVVTYEAFAMVFASMTMQAIKWFEMVSGNAEHPGLDWRKPVPSVNVLLTSTCWRNDHNGFSHQGPGFVDAVLTKRGCVTRAYFPVDANTLLATASHCFNTQNRVNVIVIDKQPQLQYLTIDEAIAHREAGISRWAWASTDVEGEEPDVVVVSCGDVMTMEALAAVAYLREHAPALKIRFLNVLNLMRLYSPHIHSHGMPDDKFDALFTKTTDIVFAYHSYPTTLHQLVHNRPNPARFHVRGYIENGTTTTPFDMVVLNKASRFHLVKRILTCCKNAPANTQQMLDDCKERLAAHSKYVVENMEDQPSIANWKWPY